MNTDNTQDAAEPSLVSAGSQEPVAWAVLLADGERIYDVYAIEEEAKAIDEAVAGNHGIVPLYRSAALTDLEREAIARQIAWIRRMLSDWPERDKNGDCLKEDLNALCRLLERMPPEWK